MIWQFLMEKKHEEMSLFKLYPFEEWRKQRHWDELWTWSSLWEFLWIIFLDPRPHTAVYLLVELLHSFICLFLLWNKMQIIFHDIYIILIPFLAVCHQLICIPLNCHPSILRDAVILFIMTIFLQVFAMWSSFFFSVVLNNRIIFIRINHCAAGRRA